MSTDKDGEWVTPIEAAKLLARPFGGLTIAKHAIATALREGLLAARAEWAAYLAEGDEELTEVEATPKRPIEIPSEVWCLSANWESDRLGFDWENGIFEIEGHFAEDDRTYGGVTILKYDLNKLDPSLPVFHPLTQHQGATRAARESIKLRRVAAPPKWNWDQAFAELIALSDQDGLQEILGVPFRRGFQAKLEGWFADWFQDRFNDAPSEDQCRIRARMVVDAIQRLNHAKSAR